VKVTIKYLNGNDLSLEGVTFDPLQSTPVFTFKDGGGQTIIIPAANVGVMVMADVMADTAPPQESNLVDMAASSSKGNRNGR
jgi:hypothetical protein